MLWHPFSPSVLLAVFSLFFTGCAHDEEPIPPAGPGITRVWAVDDCEKVRRDDLSHWAASSQDNQVWDGRNIRIFGGRNEIVAFQLILEARGTGASDVSVHLDSLRGPGAIIANRSATNDPFNFVGRHIELFLQHYINVTRRSYSGAVSTWRGARPLPDEDHLGWIPDALIPFQARPGTADWIGGAPFAIGPGRNQGVWIDITIPRDAPPGSYTGLISVTEGDSTTYRIPLTLQVYDFTLPDSTHFRNFFHIVPDLLERHPGIKNNTSKYWSLFDTYMQLFHRHRMALTDGRRTLPEFARHMGSYYTGSAYTPEHGYDGPGRGVGNSVYSIGTYDQFDRGQRSGFVPVSKEGWQAAADAWEEWFLENAPEVLRFKYMRDEPDFQPDTAAAYAEIRRRAAWLHTNTGVGRSLRTFCTVKIDPRLFGAIDIWSVTSQSGYDPGDGIPQGYIIDVVSQRRAVGEQVGFYNGTRPAYGLLEWIDAFAADGRIDPWIAWKYHVDHYFLWETGFIYNKWYREKQDVWVSPYSGRSEKRIRWGIGTIVYTGNDDVFKDESRGIDGPIASIRMKAWRRGQQDYEYLVLAHHAGITTEDVVNVIVPAALDDYNGSTYTSQSSQPIWATRGYQFEDGRRRLAERLNGVR